MLDSEAIDYLKNCGMMDLEYEDENVAQFAYGKGKYLTIWDKFNGTCLTFETPYDGMCGFYLNVDKKEDTLDVYLNEYFQTWCDGKFHLDNIDKIEVTEEIDRELTPVENNNTAMIRFLKDEIKSRDKMIKSLMESVEKTEKSREYWVKKYGELCDEIIEKKE